MISKPGNPLTEVTLYRLISLLPIMVKIFEKTSPEQNRGAVPLYRRILPYQFVFCENHSTAQQLHKIINKRRDSREAKKCVLNFS
jgi:hypothetical protein